MERAPGRPAAQRSPELLLRPDASLLPDHPSNAGGAADADRPRVAIMPGSILGTSVRRVEDLELITGASTYVGNLALPGLAHLAFVRSPLAHARITAIDTAAAAAAPGVLAVYTAADLDLPAHHGLMVINPELPRPPLATDRVRFVGEAVAVVVAETAGGRGRRRGAGRRRLRPAARGRRPGGRAGAGGAHPVRRAGPTWPPACAPPAPTRWPAPRSWSAPGWSTSGSR